MTNATISLLPNTVALKFNEEAQAIIENMMAVAKRAGGKLVTFTDPETGREFMQAYFHTEASALGGRTATATCTFYPGAVENFLASATLKLKNSNGDEERTVPLDIMPISYASVQFRNVCAMWGVDENAVANVVALLNATSAKPEMETYDISGSAANRAALLQIARVNSETWARAIRRDAVKDFRAQVLADFGLFVVQDVVDGVAQESVKLKFDEHQGVSADVEITLFYEGRFELMMQAAFTVIENGKQRHITSELQPTRFSAYYLQELAHAFGVPQHIYRTVANLIDRASY